MVICIVDLKNDRLVIGEFWAGHWFELEAQEGISHRDDYTLRFHLDGTNLICTLLPEGTVVSVDDMDLSSGSVGFFTYEAQVCFSYLTVVALP